MRAIAIPVALLLLLVQGASAREQSALEQSLTRFVWLGAVTNTSFELRMDIEPGENDVYVTDTEKFGRDTIVAQHELANGSKIAHDKKIYGNLRNFTFSDLKPTTKYFIHVFDRTKNSSVLAATVRTFPTEGTPREIYVGLGSCQIRARDGQALSELALWNEALEKSSPSATFFMLHMGDLHYGDISRNSPVLFERATRSVVTDYRGRRLFTTVPVFYMPDDHDFGGNNAGARSKAKPAAQNNFRTMVPTPNLPGSELYYAFTVGTVRFILTDLRSMATPDAGSEAGTALGKSQFEWLKNELRAAKSPSYDVVVWMSTRPWIGKEHKGSDTWGGFATERKAIANIIAEENIDNLIVVSGDAHMIAADDGTNSMYSDKPNARGFPVFHAAPLANFGSSKGGPYSEGCSAYKLQKNRQYGLLRITKPVNGKVSVEFKGYTVSGLENPKKLEARKPILSFKKEHPFLATKSVPGGGQGSCSVRLAPWWYFFAITVGILAFVLFVCYCSVKRRAQKKARMLAAMDPNGDVTGEFAPLEQQQQQQQHQQ